MQQQRNGQGQQQLQTHRDQGESRGLSGIQPEALISRQSPPISTAVGHRFKAGENGISVEAQPGVAKHRPAEHHRDQQQRRCSQEHRHGVAPAARSRVWLRC